MNSRREEPPDKPSPSAAASDSQYHDDAILLTEFEQTGESGKHFNYTKSVQSSKEPVSQEQIAAYLSKLQRVGFIQSFGCMLCVEEPSFKIIAYSENSIDILGTDTLFDSNPFKGLLHIDARTLFTHASGESLTKSASSSEISFLNPVLVHVESTHKPFYAILHRTDVGVVVDLEPIRSGDPAFSVAGSMQSQKLAVQAISRLQSLPSGDISVLCDTVVEDVQELTGYDRVMVYKFHDDHHGEVVAEIRRYDLEPYLGLHYPATDIPQVSRFLFKQNRVRMIYDCHASPVGIVQNDELKQPVCLVNSTLRAPHSCHTQYMSNMGSTASLVMAVLVTGNGSMNPNGNGMKLWGLVSCHHCSPHYVPYPLRYACELLMQAFGLQLNMELQVLAQMEEKKILTTQTLLCDMLLRDVPLGIVTQSPNIMDLVKCDGAALYYDGKCELLGVTPTELQVKDIAEWLLTFDSESTGLSTDSLAKAGYPSAASLEDVVCGMATVRITSTDFLFWFRYDTAKEVKWGGAKHRQEDKDDDGLMHPRSSFKVFLEVVKNRSLPWEIMEMNAIHSLQLILRGHSRSLGNTITTRGMDELSSVASEMVRLFETAITPVLSIDATGTVNGWNAKIAELTGLPANEAIGKSLVDELVEEECCVDVQNHLSRALQGLEDKNVVLKIKTFGVQKTKKGVLILANACTTDYRKNIVGVCFMGQDVTDEKAVMDKFIRLQGDYKAIIESLNPFIPPIFASDENACCCEWNTAMEKLTGWTRGEVLGKMLAGEIFGGMCRLKDQGEITNFMILLYHAICNQVTEKFPFAFSDRKGKFMKFLVTANKRTDMDGKVIGCFCFLQNIVPDPRLTVDVQSQEEMRCFARLKELAYIQEEIRSPLNGIRFAHKLLESTSLSDEMKQFLETSDACERQLMKIIEDSGTQSMEEGSMELKKEWFFLGSAIDAIISQVMILLNEKKLQLIHQIPEEARALSLHGDRIRLQQVLSSFLVHIVSHAPSPDSWVELKVTPTLKLNQDSIEIVQLQFSMAHPGQGLPPELIQDMVAGGKQWTSAEGLGLSLSRKLLKMMNGHVHYIREPNKCYFLVDIEFQTTRQ